VFSVKFTTTGTFSVLCDLHHGMQATVVVLPKGQALPPAAKVKAGLVAQLTADLTSLQQAAKIAPPANTVSVGSAGPGGAELFAMFPATLHVAVGTTVTFEMSPDSREVHTVTFGPESYLQTLVKGFLADPQLTQQILYPSDVPTVSLSPTSHGNGFANIGALDTESGTAPPASGTVTFTAPGTYHYICVIHPFMQGTVIVGP
jgi:plastocyanin